jgi:uncharacterized membrane protein HdeD (DUF308 family)
MTTAATRRTVPFGFDPARSDALSELLAQHWWAVGLRGILGIIFGLICLLTPGIAVGAFVVGALRLGAAFSLNIDYGRGWLALGGVASIIFGILLIIEPFIGAVVLTLWIGAYALIFGVFLLVLAFQLHSKREALVRKTSAAA